MGFGLHQVDVGIITILEGEFEALRCRMPSKPEIVNRRREYNLCSLVTRDGDQCFVALTRCLEQGNGEAQNVARDLIEDLDPQWLLVVGIAGGVPASEVTLGDIVVSTRIYDFSVEAVSADHSREYAITGGPLHPTAARVVANLPARRGDLGTWSSSTSIGADRPKVELRDDAIHGDDKWRDRVRTSLHGHFQGGQTRDPIFVSAPIASSDRLVKDADVIGSWLRVARQIRAIEMEASGVYRAAWAREIPAIAIRGISDVVGFQRDDAWAQYACQSAAAFTMAFLRLGAIRPRTSLGRLSPPPPRYATPAFQKQCELIALARERKQRLQAEGQTTDEVDNEIAQLKRELREGGQLRAGDTLADGRFHLVEKVGHGGFAFVWRAFDTVRSRDVAIKVLHANLAGDSLRLERFFRGARIMAELDHPWVVRVLDRKGHDLGFHFFVMEYLTGGNLCDAVLRKRITRGQILAVIYAVGDALARAHALRYVHRDVKPENILLAPDLTARLTDFDLVGAANTTGGTRTGMMGTYLYAAPEQLEHPEDADARADVHGLAMTLVFALHGRELPLRAARDLDRFLGTLDCSIGMKALLKRSIATEPAERTPDIASFCLALSALPEVSGQITTELCTAESSHLLAPFIRFHDRVTAPPEVAATVAFLHYHHNGRLAEAAGDRVDAVTHYRRALELRPDHLPTLTACARTLAETERWNDHLDMLVKTVDVVGDVGAKAATLLAAALVCEDRLRDLPRALSFYDAVLSVEVENPIAITRREVILSDLQRWDELADALRERAKCTTDSDEEIAILHQAASIFEDKLQDNRSAFAVLKTAFHRDRRNLLTAATIARIATAAGLWDQLIEGVVASNDRITALESLSAACANRGDWRRAAELAVRAATDAQSPDRIRLLDEAGRILDQHRGALGDTEMIHVYNQFGVMCRDLGERGKALDLFEKALEIDWTHRDTVEAISELRREEGDWEAVIHSKRTLMITATLRLRERTELLTEIGDIHRDKLQNPQKATAAYLEALEMAPEDHQLLLKILDLYTETKQWKKVVETIERFIALEPDPLRRGAYYHAAATVRLDELESFDEAVDYYNKALDSYFEDPEQLSEAGIPRALKSFEALDKALTTKRDWKAQGRAYRDMIERLPKQGSPTFRKVLVALLDGLGEIYGWRLEQYPAAAEAFEIAQQLDPRNKMRSDGSDRTEILAELYLAAGPDYIDKAVGQHVRMLRSEPSKYDSYKALRRIYMDAHQYDKSWCVCRTLAFLGKADPDERQFYEQYKRRDLVRSKQMMSPDIWSKMVHPDENRYISATFTMCWQSVAEMKAIPHKDFGVKRKERRPLQSDWSSFSQLFYYVAQVLNVQLPEVYLVEDSKSADIQFANAFERGELCPSFVVRPHLLYGKSEREIAFLSARRLTFMWPAYYLKMLLPTHTELQAVMLSAIAMVQPQFPIPPDAVQLVQHYLPEMRRRMPLQRLEQLNVVVARFIQASPEIDLARWGHAVDAISYRAGFVVCDDLEIAARTVSTEATAVNDLQVKDRTNDLVLYSISEEFFTVREQMGLAIAG